MKVKFSRLLTVHFLILSLLISLAGNCFAAEETESPEELEERILHITSIERFQHFAEKCRLNSYSQGLTVSLDTDLDFTGKDFTPIPYFQGTLDGNHHQIKGLSLTRDGSSMGLIRFVARDGIVKNLNVSGEIFPQGTQLSIGGIAGKNEGTIANCRFEGSIAGIDMVGGIVGSNQVTGIIENCRTAGSVSASHFLGGIAGENLGVIRKCINRSSINTSAKENTLDVKDISLDTITGTESANTVTDMGGIAGISSGVIRECINQGDVGYPHMGYNIGGIAGSQSGLITACQNYGTICGRKEAGGIVGQFEPLSHLEFMEDTLQILEKQIAAASALLNQASYNAQSNVGAIGAGIRDMQDYSDTAKEAITSLKPGNIQDLDSLIAAKNTLHDSLQSMQITMGDIGNAAGATVGQLGSDLRAVSAQMSAMGSTIKKANEKMGIRLKDISDGDAEEDQTGKVSDCRNFSPVSADLNAGGIAGSIAVENDMDPEKDLNTLGDFSINMEGSLRAVILRCENRGNVSVKRVNAGGIVGYMFLGLAKDCLNTGSAGGENAQFVGGIAGKSQGYIRSCNAKCRLTGKDTVGGIAGSATIVTDSLSMVDILETKEKSGGILGIREKPQDEEIPEPVKNNIYMTLRKDPGGIDGVSFQGMAQPLSPQAFQHLEALPEAFRQVTLSFRQPNRSQVSMNLPIGSVLKIQDLPEVPEKEGYTAQWEGADEIIGSRIYFDKVFAPQYTPYEMTLRSIQVRENGRPVLLAEGSFQNPQQLDLKSLSPDRIDGNSFLEAWELPAFSREEAATLRLQIPENTDPDLLQVWICSKDGIWEETPSIADASYLVFSADPSDSAIALSLERDYGKLIRITAAAAGILLFVVLTAVFKVKKRNNTIKMNGVE